MNSIHNTFALLVIVSFSIQAMDKIKNPGYSQKYDYFVNKLQQLEVEMRQECKKRGVTSFAQLPKKKNKSYPNAIQVIMDEINHYSEKHPCWNIYKRNLKPYMERLVSDTSHPTNQ